MPLSLTSVEGYVRDVRTLLLDRIRPFRYSDESILVGLNVAMQEVRRLRPDFFSGRHGMTVPQYDAVSGEEVPIEPQFRLGIVYGVLAHTLLRDDEDIQDARANSFLDKFHDILVGVRPGPIQGGTPGPGSAQK